jgi:hypothetical protein
MNRTTQNTDLRTVVKPTDKHLTEAQQNQWAAMVVARMTQAFKAKSINQVVWGDQGKK